jgi:queuine/archaeosine tRNA-ribosyltransferase
MTIQTPGDDHRETVGFKIANQKLTNLVKRLADRHICPCCMARALAFHATNLAKHDMGSAEGLEILEHIIRVMREQARAFAPESFPSTEAH